MAVGLALRGSGGGGDNRLPGHALLTEMIWDSLWVSMDLLHLHNDIQDLTDRYIGL